MRDIPTDEEVSGDENDPDLLVSNYQNNSISVEDWYLLSPEPGMNFPECLSNR
jgi:hypothetical protein